MKLRLKIVFGIIFVFSLTAFCSYFFRHNSEPEIYLISDSYTGPIVVAVNQKNGVPLEYENKSRLYRVPQSGLLLTQFGLNSGVVEPSDIKFFYVSKNGVRKELKFIPVAWTPQYAKHMSVKELNETIVYAESSGTTYNRNREQVSFANFIVGSISDAEKLSRQSTDLIHKLTQ